MNEEVGDMRTAFRYLKGVNTKEGETERVIQGCK